MCFTVILGSKRSKLIHIVATPCLLLHVLLGYFQYAPRPWGMQPNTSHDESLVLYHLSSGSAYYTIFCNSAVTGVCRESAATLGSRSLRSGKKSIFSAFASFAAVLNEKLTSRERTLVMYGRETFIRLASSVCDTPSCFIRRSIRLKNADPILSIAFIRS